MAVLHKHHLLLYVLIHAILLLSYPAKSSDEEKNLLLDLNGYRTSLNLTTLSENSNADCFADEVANQFKNQPCSNTTGADTVPGTEPQFSNYPDLLAKCSLNITDTRDGVVMPVCVPNLVPSLVLTNFTQSQYSQYLNDSTYTGAGIGSEGDWVVVVLSTKTTGGSFTTDNAATSTSTGGSFTTDNAATSTSTGGSFTTDNAATSTSIVGLTQDLMPLLLASFLLLLS